MTQIGPTNRQHNNGEGKYESAKLLEERHILSYAYIIHKAEYVFNTKITSKKVKIFPFLFEAFIETRTQASSMEPLPEKDEETPQNNNTSIPISPRSTEKTKSASPRKSSLRSSIESMVR